MLAREVLLYKQRIHGKRRIDTERYRRHLGHLLKHDGIMYRLERIFSKRTVRDSSQERPECEQDSYRQNALR